MRIRSHHTKSGIGHYNILNFCDLYKKNREGGKMPIQISEEDDVFQIYQSGKGGDLSFYKELTGQEAIIMFCLARNVTQEQIADYFQVSQPFVHRLKQSGSRKAKPFIQSKSD